MNGFEIFVKNYKNSLKSLDVKINTSCSSNSLNVLMNGLLEMNALIDLNIKCFYIHKLLITVFMNHLKQLGLNLHKLKRLSLNLWYFMPQMIETINENFKQLKRLQIIGYNNEVFVLMSESLNRCKRLTHLTLDLYSNKINDIFFTSIDKHLPKLQYLSIRNTNITSIALNSLTKLTKLQYFNVNYNYNKNITKTGVNKLMEKCPKIIKIYI